MKKKILIISMAYRPFIGGAEVAIGEITDRLPAIEYEFHMVTNRYDTMLPEVERIGNVLVHRIGITTRRPTVSDLRRFPLHLNKLLFQFLAYRKARQLHQEHHYDAVWAIMAHAAGVPAALFKRRFPDVTYLLSLQEGDPLQHIERKMRVFGPYFRRAFVSADVLQAISHFLGAWGTRMGFRGEPLIIPNAVDTSLFSKKIDEHTLRATSERLGKRDGDVFLVTTSRLYHKNAIDDVIRALAHLPGNVHFLVCGDGPEEATLRKLADALGVHGRVHFAGRIERDAIPLYLKACDIFIRPSRSEGMGNSFIEAMAAGLPVIGTQVGGIADFLYDRVRNPEKVPTGWAVGVGAPTEIASAVNDILSDAKQRQETVDNAFRMVAENYDWAHITKRMREEFFSAIATS